MTNYYVGFVQANMIIRKYFKEVIRKLSIEDAAKKIAELERINKRGSDTPIY